MFPYDRLKELLAYFLSHEGYIDSTKLAKHFLISERTLRTDLSNLNQIIANFKSGIVRKRGRGYVLYSDDTELLKGLLDGWDRNFLDSMDKRIQHLIIKLLYAKNHISQEELADEVFVSINTILSYLKTIRNILDKFSLSLENRANIGYRVVGSELDKRICILELLEGEQKGELPEFSEWQKRLLENLDLEGIRSMILGFIKEKKIHFSDYNLKNLTLHIALAISRVSKGYGIRVYKAPENEGVEELLNPLIDKMEEKYKICFSDMEKNYIYSHYILNTGDFVDEKENTEYIGGLVKKIVGNIYECYQIDLSGDEIFSRDLSHHLHSILNAKYYRLNKKNPLLKVMKENYVFYYEITETAIYQSFSDEPFSLSDDEVGYIAFHVGAAVKRYFDRENIGGRKTIIICPEGNSAANFLEAKLNSLFRGNLEILGKLQVNELEDMSLDKADFLISTVNIKDSPVQVVRVELPLMKRDIENISKAINSTYMVENSYLDTFLPEDVFMRIDSEDKSEIIHRMAKQLLDRGYVNEDFEAEVLKRERKITTDMDGVIAIPHPLSICSLNNTVAVGILEKPISWSKERKAQIILMLALSGDYRKNVERLYDVLTFMMNNPELQTKLLKSRTMKEFVDVLKANLDKEE